jgi:predicted anti-sigma-YlaC factor YlaD
MAGARRREIAPYTCTNCLAALCDYLDRVQDASTVAAVERHLGGCRKCRIVFETTARTVSLYRNIAIECSVPPEVEARLLSVLGERAAAGRSG